MAVGRLTEARAARLGLAVAMLAGGVQLLVGTAWSLTHDDPTVLDRTLRCFRQEQGLNVGEIVGDAVASSASGGTLTTDVEGNLLVVAIVTSRAEAERLGAEYAALGGDVGERLEVRGRYVRLWHRAPTPSQQRIATACEY